MHAAPDIEDQLLIAWQKFDREILTKATTTEQNPPTHGAKSIKGQHGVYLRKLLLKKSRRDVLRRPSGSVPVKAPDACCCIHLLIKRSSQKWVPLQACHSRNMPTAVVPRRQGRCRARSSTAPQARRALARAAYRTGAQAAHRLLRPLPSQKRAGAKDNSSYRVLNSPG